ncbi:unnamed protein product [Larinioides sclopetarius]|uniref:Uncharacterized protein n=1 Tax=Larinioides sclopetarius TaxID=280406 RepID=A0AAV2AY47_9ARAC
MCVSTCLVSSKIKTLNCSCSYSDYYLNC